MPECPVCSQPLDEVFVNATGVCPTHGVQPCLFELCALLVDIRTAALHDTGWSKMEARIDVAIAMLGGPDA
jgi:hypothetical protein